MSTPLDRYCAFFAAFGPKSPDYLGELYANQARFRDPFNDVVGVAAIRRVFAHGVEQCPGMRFEILLALPGRRGGEDIAMIRWRMHCPKSLGGLQVEGSSFLRFSPAGKVVEHIDDWDPASQLYERLPLLGWLMRRIRARLRA